MTREELVDQLWYTYKARFNTHSRLIMSNSLYTIIASSLAVYIIFLNILQLLPTLTDINQEAVTFYTISLSIITLVISLIFRFSDNKYDASKYHECALEIKELYNEIISCFENMDTDTFKNYLNKYSALLKKYAINHSMLDYQKVKIDKKESSCWKTCIFHFNYFFRYYFILIILLVVPAIVGILIVI